MRACSVRRSSWLALLALLLAMGQAAPPAAADGDGYLSPSLRISVCGDVVAAGVGLRGEGNGDITLAGIPPGGRVVKALLYWATLGTSSGFTSPELNGIPVDGALIGTTGSMAWGDAGNYTYRADVTGRVSGNGSYTVTGLPKSGPDDNDSQGAALVAVYASAGAPHRTVVVNDGAVPLTPTIPLYTDTISGFRMGDSMEGARITYLVADGQGDYPGQWPDGDVTVHGTVIATNVFSGTDGAYWDTLSFEVPGLATATPFTTTINRNYPYAVNRDWLVWVATVFSAESRARIYLPLATRRG